MIGDVVIENFKSIAKLELSLGRITVLIGANGCGKSNILEALALCSAAAGNKLDNEFLAPRGLRVPDNPHLFIPAFTTTGSRVITIRLAEKSPTLEPSGSGFAYESSILLQDSVPYPYLHNLRPIGYYGAAISTLQREHPELFAHESSSLSVEMEQTLARIPIRDFLIYSPENDALRNFAPEGQILPVGIHGEGLFKLLSILSSTDAYPELKEQLRLIDWFTDFDLSPTVALGDRALHIKDRYFDPDLPAMTQRSANEGFLFLLFYFCLFISDLTPRFFAVDNVDASLNPKLCAKLMVQLTELAKKHDKQAIFTTHNPAILDGLNLDDDEQRLYVIYRNQAGHTKAKRVMKPTPLPGQEPVKLSEAFLRGYLGGLPDNF